MSALEGFIARMVIKYSTDDLEKGKALYRKYFIATNIYAKFKAGVDAAVKEAGFDKVISES